MSNIEKIELVSSSHSELVPPNTVESPVHESPDDLERVKGENSAVSGGVREEPQSLQSFGDEKSVRKGNTTLHAEGWGKVCTRQRVKIALLCALVALAWGLAITPIVFHSLPSSTGNINDAHKGRSSMGCSIDNTVSISLQLF